VILTAAGLFGAKFNFMPKAFKKFDHCLTGYLSTSRSA
jgi:hypothetical protein